jgi:hypothetical protein
VVVLVLDLFWGQSVKKAKAGFLEKKGELVVPAADITVDAGTLKWSVP